MMFFCTSAKNAKGRWRKIMRCLTDIAGKFREKHENQRRSKCSYVLALKCAEKLHKVITIMSGTASNKMHAKL